jgi:hypothetical protein
MRPIPKGNKGLAKLSKPVRNQLGFMARGGKTKGYAYGSMVRSPMNPETSMTSMFNPMQPRQQGMNRGGKIKSHEQQESPAFERMEKKSKGYMD